MLVVTIDSIKGYPVQTYHGIVSGGAVVGANIVRDKFAKLRDVGGGHVHGFEKVLQKARESALKEMQDSAEKMGANAVLGVAIDYEFLGQESTILLVTASGTAVTVGKKGSRPPDAERDDAGRKKPKK
jgi:uncharacterized protein YbjQ (UPF0145 family)